jgi:hypothetical protein
VAAGQNVVGDIKELDEANMEDIKELDGVSLVSYLD